MKIKAVSFERYRASARERRQYGGKTVTRFYVWVVGDEDRTRVVATGYGSTPGERKTHAIAQAKKIWEERHDRAEA